MHTKSKFIEKSDDKIISRNYDESRNVSYTNVAKHV